MKSPASGARAVMNSEELEVVLRREMYPVEIIGITINFLKIEPLLLDAIGSICHRRPH